jgi:murein DD-endopeptidase MepM/ murein hydrolase activator NlpD
MRYDINIKKILLIGLLLVALGIGLNAGYDYYFVDEYAIIKPLPAGVPLEIRVDRYGDGHFGAKRRGYRHRGIDISADVGTPVLAAKSGWSEKVTYDDLSGNYIVLSHRDGTKSYYLHLDKVLINPHRWIRQGQVIGLVGKTGNADCDDMITHLHFEIRKDKRALNILKAFELEDYNPDSKD